VPVLAPSKTLAPARWLTPRRPSGRALAGAALALGLVALVVAPVDLAAEGRVAIAAFAVAADAPQMLRHAAETVMRTVAVGAGLDLPAVAEPRCA